MRVWPGAPYPLGASFDGVGTNIAVFSEIAESIEHWKKFIRSGAHPQFQDRAKAHLQKLTLRKNFQFDTPATDLGREPAITPLKRVPPMRRP